MRKRKYVTVIDLLKNDACWRGVILFMWIARGPRIRINEENILKNYVTLVDNPALLSYMFGHNTNRRWYHFMHEVSWRPDYESVRLFVDAALKYLREEDINDESVENP